MPTPESFRSRFPALRDSVHLASCSHGALSDELIEALFEYQYTLRERGAPWDRWMVEVDTARSMFAQFIGADYDEVAIVPSASAGAFQVASTQEWSEHPRLITTDVEFPSIAQVWLAQAVNGVDVTHVAARDGIVYADDYMDLIDDRTGLVSIPLISYRNGMRLPAAEVVAHSRALGIRTVVDAYQGAGVEPIDVRELGCDYLISGTLKYMLGIPGLAFVYVRPGLSDAVPPVQTGWFGRVNPFEFNPHQVDYPAHARRFESGTPSIPSAFGAVAGMRLLQTLDGKDVASHIADLGQRLDDRLRTAGERIASPADPKLRGPMVAVLDDDPAKLAAYLASQRIDTSPRGNAVRLSLHFYNTVDDVVAVDEAIRRYRSR